MFYEQLEAGAAGDANHSAALAAQLLALQRRADALSKANEFGSLLQRAGGVGLNAGTSHDATKYYVSLPANKLELWFAMEAERFQVQKPSEGGMITVPDPPACAAVCRCAKHISCNRR